MTTSNASFQPANRSNVSLLAAIEKRTLIYIAMRLPAWVNSDHLTVLGFVSLAVTGLLYWEARANRAALAVAVVFLALNWFGDRWTARWRASAIASGLVTVSMWTTSWTR
jgi:hypothetical protein